MKVTQNYFQLKQQNKLKTQKIQKGRKNEEQRKNYKIQKHKEHLKKNHKKSNNNFKHNSYEHIHIYWNKWSSKCKKNRNKKRRRMWRTNHIQRKNNKNRLHIS